MAPEYGATMGFFPIDDECVNYLRATGRSEEHCRIYENYYRAQGLFGMPKKGEIDYSVRAGTGLGDGGAQRGRAETAAGPNRTAESEAGVPRGLSPGRSPRAGSAGRCRIWARLSRLRQGGFASGRRQPGTGLAREAQAHNTNPLTELEMANNGPRPTMAGAEAGHGGQIRHGSVLIAAITSCTNTSNPSVMLAAGLLAKKAVERGLQVNPLVKASLAPGSRVVTDYLNQTGLQPYLDQLGFNLVGYGCTTCIGNSGPLPAPVDEAIGKHDLVAASVLSGNRNFEARVHQNIKANFLMSPPLVVAFALAGRVDIDLSREPIGRGKDGQDVYLRDIWPTLAGGARPDAAALKPEVFRQLYRDFAEQNPKWNEIPAERGQRVSMGRRQHLYPGAALLPGVSACSPARSGKSKGRARWASLATASRPTTFRRPAASRKLRPPGNT